ncbi:phospholipase D family protein [Serratia plymuthica A30]|nr:phospholipase D family protein [Serratia plymuthica A30]
MNDKYLAQHNKFLIVDSVTVQTGSFNYSSAASYKNAENVIVLLNAPGVASDYQSTFDQLWAEGQQVNKTY